MRFPLIIFGYVKVNKFYHVFSFNYLSGFYRNLNKMNEETARRLGYK